MPTSEELMRQQMREYQEKGYVDPTKYGYTPSTPAPSLQLTQQIPAPPSGGSSGGGGGGSSTPYSYALQYFGSPEAYAAAIREKGIANLTDPTAATAFIRDYPQYQYGYTGSGAAAGTQPQVQPQIQPQVQPQVQPPLYW